ncbi:MAG: FtsX-like permease family protein [Myxococcales bacterium]|nr:FtsX-like permease family protein [Myxococcales bacterium]
MISAFVVLVRIALRNLFASAINLVIGAIILFGTALVVVGGALLDSVDRAMSSSVIGSVAGHLQVYSAASRDELALYGDFGGEADLSPIQDFPKVKRALLSIEGVRKVVPMGINAALVASGNTVDLVLAELRELSNRKAKKETGLEGELEAQKQHVRQIIRVLRGDLEKSLAVMDKSAIEPEDLAALEQVSKDEFWAGFDRDPFGALEFLENRVAPQVSDADLLYLRYVGTDLGEFLRSFDRIRIVDGGPVPDGKRGFLFAKFFYEEGLKLKTARRLDKIHEALAQSGKKIAGDPVLERYVRENQSQTRDIVLQLGPEKTRLAIERLQRALLSKEQELSALLSSLFATDDSNFQERYRIFYEQVAPLLSLYRVRVGDTLTIKAFTRSGNVRSVNVKVYGTFAMEGLDKSPLAAAANLMDLMTFRDLYGFPSAETAEEISAMKAAAGAKEVDRSRAEEELFGGALVTQGSPVAIEESAVLGVRPRSRAEQLEDRVYTAEEIESGVVLNAAVLLDDAGRVPGVLRRIEELSGRERLGLKAVSWQKASGILGQMATAMKAALFFSAGIVFVIAMVIINNAMMMATLQRTQTIGTLRAIGAQRPFVLSMVLVETLVLGFLFGGGGALLGSLVMLLLGARGIPAFDDATYFFFSGPRLFPTLEVAQIAFALGIVTLVSIVSTLIPAVVATRVSPVVAMQAEE